MDKERDKSARVRPDLLVEAHYACGVPLFWQGELRRARMHFERGIQLYDPQLHRSHVFRYGIDPGVACLLYAAWTLVMFGYYDQGLKRAYEALTLAQNLAHPFSLGYALIALVMTHLHRRESQLVRERADDTIAFCREQGFPFFLAAATIARGWALTQEGRNAEGIEQIQQGLATWQATGTELIRPHYLTLLAEAYGRGGQVDQGLACVAEAVALVQQHDERVAEPALYRLQGELMLQQSEGQGLMSAAEGYFRKAIEVARRQGVKTLELRAVMSLSRLWQQQGKRKEAHKMLAEIYGWFTEGFDTVDLKEAKALLEELSY